MNDGRLSIGRAPLKHCGNGLAQIEIRMVVGGGLRVERAFAICGKPCAFGIWREPENKIFRLQT
ncbi:MAG: hypothetical protein ABJA66_09530 [Actinomycetota bacterium]